MARHSLTMEHAICPVTLLAFLAAISHVQAQEIGDPQKGLALARSVCSECHAIGRGQVGSPNPSAPTFTELANTPGMTTTALYAALTTPHANMPNLILGAERIRDVSAYIVSLKEGN
jgi:mono/diheme cytochrome c family protein